MKTFPAQDWLRPSSSLVKNRSHLAFSAVAHGSSVKPPKTKESSSNKLWGVGHSGVALEKCTPSREPGCGGSCVRVLRGTLIE